MSSTPINRPHLFEQLEHWLAHRWVIIALNAVALVLLVLSVAQWTWRLLIPANTSTAAPTMAVNNNVADYDLSALLGANLFGQAVPLSSGRVSLENIPLSSLNLVVTGVFATPKSAIALISANGAPETPYAVGQEIVAGASLYAVYADRVLIRRGGITESLMLKDTGVALPSGSILSADSAPRGGGTVDVQRTDARNFNVDRQQITQQMQKPEFLTQALMVPNAGGGFLVREIQAGSLYEKLGLRVGDVINTVNGQSVNTVEDVMRLYQQFGANAGSQISIQIRRSGRIETLQYNLQ